MENIYIIYIFWNLNMGHIVHYRTTELVSMERYCDDDGAMDDDDDAMLYRAIVIA